jgi:hypothetical protein
MKKSFSVSWLTPAEFIVKRGDGSVRETRRGYLYWLGMDVCVKSNREPNMQEALTCYIQFDTFRAEKLLAWRCLPMAWPASSRLWG